MTNPDVRPIPVAEFEGEFVRIMEGKLPAITLDMPEGYVRGTHLKMEVEVRVRNVSYLEDKKGDLTRQHTFALEEVKLTEAFDPANRPNNVGGNSAGDAWVEPLLDFLEGDVDELDFDGAEVPDRLREMLKLWSDRATNDGPAITSEESECGMGCSPTTACSPECEERYAVASIQNSALNDEVGF